MRTSKNKDKGGDDLFLKLTAVQLVFCFIAFAAVFWAGKANTGLFESFREEYSRLNEKDFDPGSFDFFETVKRKRDNETKETQTDESVSDEEISDEESGSAESESGSGSETQSEEKEELPADGLSAAAAGATAVMPVNGRITSPFGERTHPVYGCESFHSGEDIAAPEGTPVYSALDGTVTDVGVGEKSGNYVKIAHDGGFETLYCHLRDANVESGITVRQGDVIGFVGQTGLATGPHLHFEVKLNGEKIDPEALLEGAAVVS
ncbi:MAG: M23 family metallopeptidase [Clostridia bacterium]|nr:M23 family metallopeptidase [Clostridia bacterium]